jgi:hypothetical protein
MEKKTYSIFGAGASFHSSFSSFPLIYKPIHRTPGACRWMPNISLRITLVAYLAASLAVITPGVPRDFLTLMPARVIPRLTWSSEYAPAQSKNCCRSGAAMSGISACHSSLNCSAFVICCCTVMQSPFAPPALLVSISPVAHAGRRRKQRSSASVHIRGKALAQPSCSGARLIARAL